MTGEETEEESDLGDDFEAVEKIESEEWEEKIMYYCWGEGYDEARKWTCPKCGESVVVFVPFNYHPEAGHDNIHFIKPETIRLINPIKRKHLPDHDVWLFDEEMLGKELRFYRMIYYLDELKKGLRKPDGKDKWGDVPGICQECKSAEVAVYSSRGNFCNKCDRKKEK